MAPWRIALHDVIFGTETPLAKAFDIGLLWIILASVVCVSLESVASIEAQWGPALRLFDWVVTVIFTVEYLARMTVVARPVGYARSFFGVVDLLAIIPTYLSVFVSGAQALVAIRVLRLLRVFRLLEQPRFSQQAQILFVGVLASREKIAVFLVAVVTLAVFLGAVMFVVEGPAAGFTSIPISVYWAIVTLTTVGYGDIAPQSPLGQVIASIVMLLGYGIIAVPTGIVSVELHEAARQRDEADSAITDTWT
jgi:voltage-gated potassium channel